MLERKTLITFSLIAAALAAMLLLLPTPPAEDPAAGAPASDVTVIDNARYFDGAQMQDPAAVVIADGQVLRVEPPGGGPVNARRVDASGKTLLPGLFDAHVHTFASAQRDALAFGVTTLIDMFTSPALLDGARAARDGYGASGEAALFSAGMLATVDGGHGTQYGIAVDTLSGPAAAADWVAARLAEGSDFIKLVYMPYAGDIPSLDLATATAVIEAAHDAGVMAVAHIASQAGARDLLDAGIDGFVHVFADAPVDDAFLAAAVERGIFVVPTLAVIAMVDGQSTGPGLVDDPELGPRLTPAARTNLRQDFGRTVPGFGLDTALANVAALHAAGVPILAGSDAPNPGTAHGATLHAELALLVRAGLSETEALAAATALPARLFGADGRGVIAPGARADLVLVDGAPDADITATRAIDTVYRNGRPLDTESVASTSEQTLRIAGTLGNFDTRLDAPEGLLWAETSDTMMGGGSSAEIARVPRGDGGALSVTTTVSGGFAFPWAGAYLGPAAEGLVGDLGDARAIAFDVRGTPASYRLMLFVSGGMGAPPVAEFSVGEDWRRVEIALADVAGFEPDRFAGMAFVTPMRTGDYAFEIDNVTLLR